jgi:DNA primase
VKGKSTKDSNGFLRTIIMSDLQAIKRKILEENALDRIYEAMGCEYISYSGNRIEAQLPSRYNSTNKRAVQTKLNDSLTSQIRNRADFRGGDIFSLISYLVNDKRGEEDIRENLYESKKFICETLGWTEFLKVGEYKTKKDYVAPLKAIMRSRQQQREIKPNPVIPEEVLDEYVPYPSYDWIQEGISYKTQKMYGIGFDLESKRITIPMRNRFGQLVGVKGRIMKDEDDERKYLYLHRYNNRYEWFNFHFAHPYILMDKKVYIFEAEKSPMKAFDNGIYNTLGVGASEISPEQAQIVKSLGLDIEVVLCYDKGITLDEIRRNAELFEGRKVYAMFDSDNLLEDKDSPIDKGVEVWNKLVEDYIFEIKSKK